MHLVWKRPDGFHNANPNDYYVVDLGNNFRLWLHKVDKEQYPFRIAGGWEQKEASIELNKLVNLLGEKDGSWLEQLDFLFSHSMKDDRSQFIDDLLVWLTDLLAYPKGDTWETEIMKYTLTRVHESVNGLKSRFATNVDP